MIAFQQANEIWTILAQEAGARESDRLSFVRYITERTNGEYRFNGTLGMGGKLYFSELRCWINCYAEDKNSERLETILKVNERLKIIHL